MNDFLQSIRNGNFSKDNGNSVKSRFNSQRPRRNYEPNGNYSRNGNDRKYRSRQHNDMGMMDETLSAIKETLTAILAHQETGNSLAERRAIAEERKADAFEFIAHHIAGLTNSLYAPKHDINDCGPEHCDENEKMDTRSFSPSVSHGDANGENKTEMTKDDILALIMKMRNDGSTYNEIASHLLELDLPTFSGRGKWHAQTIHRLCQTV